MRNFSRQFQTAVVIARTEGLGRLGARLINFIRSKLRMASKAQLTYERKKALVDAAFDAAGLDTGGVHYLRDLRIVGENAAHGINHVASDPDDFDAAVNAITVASNSSTFIDLGSGKGRALLLAAKYPFPEIIGVEFALELHEAAKKNVDKAMRQAFDCARIKLVLGDATTYEFPDTPIVLYLFNPFGSKIVQKVAENAMTSWRSARRPFTIIYVNPIHADRFLDAGWRQSHRERAFSLFLPE